VDDHKIMTLGEAWEKYAGYKILFLYAKHSDDPKDALGWVYAIADSGYEWGELMAEADLPNLELPEGCVMRGISYGNDYDIYGGFQGFGPKFKAKFLRDGELSG
jgi:hypothetical protein